MLLLIGFLWGISAYFLVRVEYAYQSMMDIAFNYDVTHTKYITFARNLCWSIWSVGTFVIFSILKDKLWN